MAYLIPLFSSPCLTVDYHGYTRRIAISFLPYCTSAYMYATVISSSIFAINFPPSLFPFISNPMFANVWSILFFIIDSISPYPWKEPTVIIRFEIFDQTPPPTCLKIGPWESRFEGRKRYHSKSTKIWYLKVTDKFLEKVQIFKKKIIFQII